MNFGSLWFCKFVCGAICFPLPNSFYLDYIIDSFITAIFGQTKILLKGKENQSSMYINSLENILLRKRKFILIDHQPDR